PRAPAQVAYVTKVVVAEGADEDRRRVAFLDHTFPDVEAARRQAVRRVRVVVDDPDPHGADAAYLLRLEIDSVASTGPRTSSARMGLSRRSAATSVLRCLSAMTTASKCRPWGSSRTSGRSSGKPVASTVG